MNRRAMFGQASPQADPPTSAFLLLCLHCRRRRKLPNAHCRRRREESWQPGPGVMASAGAPEFRASVWTAGYAPPLERPACYQGRGMLPLPCRRRRKESFSQPLSSSSSACFAVTRPLVSNIAPSNFGLGGRPPGLSDLVTVRQDFRISDLSPLSAFGLS
jgi:hypothetical protein